MKRSHITTTALALVLLAGTANAGEIYKYTDENGNIHYGDRPSGVATEQRVAMVSRNTDRAAVQARIESRRNNTAEETDVASEPPKKTRAERRAEQQQRQERCESYRAKMETLVTSRRLYREDENGERVYLDDSESQEARDRVQQLIEDNCG